MPKPSLKNPFVRRKSSGNILETEGSSDAPAQSSFRVIERPEKSKIVFDGSGPFNRSNQVARPFSSPLQQLRGKSVDDLTYHANGSVDTAASRKAATALKASRGSGGTTHSGSSDFYQSSSASGRHSSSSTLPSSVDIETAEDEELFPARPPPAVPSKQATPLETIDEPLPPPPSFTARAQRAFSFGLKNKQPAIASPPTPPATVAATISAQRHSPSRERALTTSSYASTAVPGRQDTRLDLGTDFGGNFSSMFDREDAPVPPPKKPSRQVRPDQTARRAAADDMKDSEPGFSVPSSRGSPARFLRQDTQSPYLSDRRGSDDELLASSDSSPNLAGNSGFFPDTSKGYAPVPNASSAEPTPLSENGSIVDIDSDGVKRYQLRDSQIGYNYDSLSRKLTTPAPIQEARTLSPFTSGAANPWEDSSSTPKALKRVSAVEDEPLFDAVPGPASRARRIAAESSSASSPPRRMTKTQFEILRKYTDSSDAAAAADADSDNEYEDDDEKERAEKLVKQRRKQEANMAVYRQQMKKVTGGGPTDLPMRPNLDTRASSTPSIHVGGVPVAPPPDALQSKQSDDEDDDIPLGILQAHGFPNGNRPPTRLGDSYRPPSVAAQRSSMNLPAFARRLPEDPYFGAGLVHPAARESLAFGGGSVYGGNSAPPTPGGLVGIIASEERQRQARRGSPNPATGTYNMPMPTNMPGMNRMSSMASLQSQMPQMMPQMPMMPPMPMSNDPAMQEFMQMQMQFMQNMQAMLHMQQTQMQGQPGAVPRPDSSMSRGLEQSRTMSTLAPAGGWNAGTTSRPQSTLDPRMSSFAPSVHGYQGYTPSIAPSERSNVGMPSRYRPVQMEGDGRTNSLTSSLTLNAFSGQPSASNERPASSHFSQSKSTIRVVDKPKGMPRARQNQSTEDDEDGGWGAMTTKRSRRMSKATTDRAQISDLYQGVEV